MLGWPVGLLVHVDFMTLLTPDLQKYNLLYILLGFAVNSHSQLSYFCPSCWDLK